MTDEDRYQLKVKIDEMLRATGATAIPWVTHWTELRIVKYDHPSKADRRVIADWFIKSEADWNALRPEIEQALQTLSTLIGRQVRIPDTLPEGYEEYAGQDAVIIKRFADGDLYVETADGTTFVFSPEEIV